VLANPALNERTLEKEIGHRLPPGRTADPISPWTPPDLPERPDTMTAAGTVRATLVLLAFTLAGAAFGWSQVETTTRTVRTPAGGTTTVTAADMPGWLWLGVLGALGVAFVVIAKPKLARVLGPVYGLLYGAALGGISAAYEAQWDGVVPQAVLATVSVFVVMLVLYATGAVRVTPRLRMAIIGATAGIFLLYLVSIVLSLFGVDLLFWREPSALGIGISVLIVGVAAFNLLLDFDFIDRSVAAGAPKHLEWYGAFGLTVTIVWLYLELLRLLSLLQRR
jgi:uncharacterized YccA/Bax inhibitor family protein